MSARRGKEWVYPNRKRCLRCRSYFGFCVFDGLYCSIACARIEAISSNANDWPREHYSLMPHSNVRREKRNWMSMERAQLEASQRIGKQAYRCSYCLGFHFGSRMPGKVYPGDRVEPR